MIRCHAMPGRKCHVSVFQFLVVATAIVITTVRECSKEKDVILRRFPITRKITRRFKHPMRLASLPPLFSLNHSEAKMGKWDAIGA